MCQWQSFAVSLTCAASPTIGLHTQYQNTVPPWPGCLKETRVNLKCFWIGENVSLKWRANILLYYNVVLIPIGFFLTMCTKEKKIPIKLLYLEMKSPVHAMLGQTEKLGGAQPWAPTTCRAYGVLFGCTPLHGQTSSRNTVYSKMQTTLQSCPQEPMSTTVQPYTSFQPYPFRIYI